MLISTGLNSEHIFRLLASRESLPILPFPEAFFGVLYRHELRMLPCTAQGRRWDGRMVVQPLPTSAFTGAIDGVPVRD